MSLISSGVGVVDAFNPLLDPARVKGFPCEAAVVRN